VTTLPSTTINPYRGDIQNQTSGTFFNKQNINQPSVATGLTMPQHLEWMEESRRKSNSLLRTSRNSQGTTGTSKLPAANMFNNYGASQDL